MARLAAPVLLLFLMPSPAFAAGGDLPPLVRDIGYSQLLAGVLAVLFTRFHIPSIAAFLAAGRPAGLSRPPPLQSAAAACGAGRTTSQ